MALSLALLANAPRVIAEPSSEKPGLFVLHNVTRGPLDPSALNSNYINGVALQVGWRDVQPEEGKYDWSQIDSFINMAKHANKRITLHLLPLRPPQWVFDAGAEPFTFTIRVPGNPRQGDEVTEYVPWDPVFLKKWTTLVEQFGARYNAEPSIFAISVTAPAPEMMLPGSFPPHGESFRRLQEMYNRDAYLSAWRQMIDVYQRAFPAKPKFVAPGIVLEDAYFADEVLEYASNKFGNKLWVFSAGLKATRPSRFPPMIHIYSLLEQYGKKANLGFQMIWSASR
ncbi:MAG: beta-galactosidase, partial [Methylosarcina sp.]